MSGSTPRLARCAQNEGSRCESRVPSESVDGFNTSQPSTYTFICPLYKLICPLVTGLKNSTKGRVFVWQRALRLTRRRFTRNPTVEAISRRLWIVRTEVT